MQVHLPVISEPQSVGNKKQGGYGGHTADAVHQDNNTMADAKILKELSQIHLSSIPFIALEYNYSYSPRPLPYPSS